MAATRTSRLRLYKPDSAGGDNVNVQTDINDNADIIDSLMGFVPVTSSTYPASGYRGEAFYETDTGKAYLNTSATGSALSRLQVMVASASAAGTATFDNAITVSSGDITASSGQVKTTRAVSASTAYAAYVSGDTQPRVLITAGGVFNIGAGGSASPDVNFYRSGANTLKTDDDFQVAGALTVAGAASLASATVSGNLAVGSAVLRPIPGVVGAASNTASETAIATFTIAANDATVGAVYKIRIWGTVTVTGTPTLQLRSRIGGVAGTALVAFSAVTVRSGATDGYFDLELEIQCVSTGASGTYNAGSKYTHNFLSSAITYTPIGPIMATGVTKDTTASADLVVTAQFNAASPSNVCTARVVECVRVA